MTARDQKSRLAMACEALTRMPTRPAEPHATEAEQHADYPHLPGTLYDCPACEARCHCTPGATECVYKGEHNGLAGL